MLRNTFLNSKLKKHENEYKIRISDTKVTWNDENSLPLITIIQSEEPSHERAKSLSPVKSILRNASKIEAGKGMTSDSTSKLSETSKIRTQSSLSPTLKKRTIPRVERTNGNLVKLRHATFNVTPLIKLNRVKY